MDVKSTPLDLSASKSMRVDQPVVATALIVGIGVVLLLALRDGQDWGGDFALYIMNARNIVLGLPYAKTAYLLNPNNAIHPAAYPPGLPLLFAPVYACCGVNLLIMKRVCIAALLAFLAIYYRSARTLVSPMSALVITAVVGLHPYILESENSPDSEFPFMFFCYGGLYTLFNLQGTYEPRKQWPAALLGLAGVFVAMAYLTRSIGILLLPAALLVSVLHTRRLMTPTTVALTVAVTLIALAQTAFPADIGTYVHYFDHWSLHGLRVGIERYLGVRAILFGKAARAFPWIGLVLGSALLLSAAIGFADRVRRRVSVFETFFAMYVMFLIIYPITLDTPRYSMPIWPLLFLYCARGIELIAQPLDGRQRALSGVAVCALVAGLYGTQYASTSFATIPNSVDAPVSQALFEAVREKVPSGARILARKPTIIGLYTGHEAMIWPETFTDEELWTFLQQMNIQYIVQDPGHLGVRPIANDPLDAFLERNRGQLTVLYHNDSFNLFRVRRQR